MKAIGGYPEFEHYHGSLFYDRALALNTVRNAILYAADAHGYHKLYLPDYLCQAISDCLHAHAFPFEEYPVGENLEPLFTQKNRPGECVLLVNYFGQLTNKKILEYQKRFGTVMVDNTQAFFSPPVHGVDTVYNCRKYFGVPDGAFLYTEMEPMRELEQDVSCDRFHYLFGRLEQGAEAYYSAFGQNEALLNKQDIKKMSRATGNILRSLNYDQIKSIREANFRHLHRRLKPYNRLQLQEPDGPFMYPLYIENGKEFKRRLIEKQIYVPTLWPNILQAKTPACAAYRLADDLVPLPIDQRYGTADMETILSALEDAAERVGYDLSEGSK